MSDTLYQLKVTLVDSAPQIWRRVVVPGTITLKQLHLVLQGAMGWTNYHLPVLVAWQYVHIEPQRFEETGECA